MVCSASSACADVTVEAGKAADLGELVWVPVRYGRQLWEIGIPDRTAGEFRHGDHYWQWGLYNLYPQEFPNGVDFVIGKSDWKRDWNYAQPPVPDDKGGWKDSTWRIRFDLDHATHGTASLRLDLRRARRAVGRGGQQRAGRRHGRTPGVGRHAPRRHPWRRTLPRHSLRRRTAEARPEFN